MLLIKRTLREKNGVETDFSIYDINFADMMYLYNVRVHAYTCNYYHRNISTIYICVCAHLPAMCCGLRIARI